MASDKQIAANRTNARKSTGPKTPEGKARVAQNGIRHGLLAKSFVLGSEDKDAFRNFVETYHREYQPATATELALVHTMATARWRLIRTANIESATLDFEAATVNHPGANLPTRIALAHRQAVTGSRSIDVLSRGEARLQRQFDSAFDRLRQLRAGRLREIVDKEGIPCPGANCGPNPFEERYESREVPSESIT